MRSGIRRFAEEFFLYSSQFVAFFIFILFITPDSGSLGILAAGILAIFIIVQTVLLATSGHMVILRFLYSLITPFGYSLIRGVAGGFQALEMANVFLWGTAIYSGFFQTAALSAKSKKLRQAAEGFLALGSAIIFVFFYYYINLKLGVEADYHAGDMDRAAYSLALDIRAFPYSFLDFIRKAQHWFPAFGATTFAFMLLASKMRVISLQSRIERLFGSAEACTDTVQIEPDHAARRIPVTIVSSDILGFTDISERLGPAGATDLLNRYYSLWQLESSRRAGNIFSITGDSVILVFGLDSADVGAEGALSTSLSFMEELAGLRDDLSASGYPATFDVSIGIHTGTIVVGSLGPGENRKTGVFGDAIAVAARLDSLCRELKQDLIVSQTTFSRLGLDSQASLESMGEVLLRNSTHPVPVYGKKQKYH